MVYDIEKMSQRGLEKLFQVASYLKDKAEINGFPTLFTIEENLRLKDLSNDDLNDIISGFLGEGILSDRERVNYKLVCFGDSEEDDVIQTNDVLVRIDYEKLNNFCDILEKKINELKKNSSLIFCEYNLSKNIILDEKNRILKFGNNSLKFRGGISFDILIIVFSDSKESHDYSEMAYNIDKEDDKLIEKIRHACEYINEKILSKVGVKDFLVFNYSKVGSVKINEKYF